MVKDTYGPVETRQRLGAGVDARHADAVVARLSALTQAARVFGSGIAGVDLDIGWAPPGKPERASWSTGEGGRRRVELRLDLERMVATMDPSRSPEQTAHIESFRSAFLHELGHVLFSGRPPGEPLLDEAGREPLVARLPEETQRLARLPSVRQLLNEVGEILEDARVERRLAGRFRGAQRYLRDHAAEALEMARGGATDSTTSKFIPSEMTPGWATAGDPRSELARIVALLYLEIAGIEDRVSAQAIPVKMADSVARLKAPLLAAVDDDDPSLLGDWLLTHLLVELADTFPATLAPASTKDGRAPGSPEIGAGQGPEQVDEDEHGRQQGPHDERPSDRPPTDGPGSSAAAPPSTAEASGEAASSLSSIAERLMSPGLLAPERRTSMADERSARRESPLRARIIVYPHTDSTLVIDEVSVAEAHSVAPTVQSRQVLENVARRYGPPALEAFAAERAALRRAFEVNYEQRFAGRYRSGRRVGVRNLRRMAVSRDLRLFQKLEVPDRLSYYFHLLIDVSPSMLSDRNAAKAIAVGYAFTEALDRLRVPVDVSLYSAAVTEIYDHRRDRLDRFFGEEFGYYSSGTHEIEAIAYAKQKADAVYQAQKLIVVLTDGHPNSVALHRAGSNDLRAYYRTALIPWLRQAGIELMAIGIGHSPSYHEKAVAIGSSWQSIGVFMELLDRVVAEGRARHAALWL